MVRDTSVRGRTVNTPTAKTPQRMAFFLTVRLDLRKIGRGMMMIMMSEEMLKTAFVMRWFVAAEHCAKRSGLAVVL